MVGFPACFIRISLLCQLTGTAASGALKKLVGDVGGSVIFPLNIQEQQVDSIVWTFNTTLVTIQPGGANKLDNVIVTQRSNKDRVNFPSITPKNYSLILSNLRKNDSGAYRVEIHSSQLEMFTQRYELRVYEHLSKPKITMGLQNKENGTCVTNLTCSMEQGGEDVTYSWKSLGTTANESHSGSTLPISWALGESNTIFICVVKNPISSNQSNPVSAEKFCEGAAGDKDAPMVFLWLLMVLFLFIFLALGLLFSTQRQQRKVPEIIEEKGTDIYQEITNFCPHSGENTEDDTVSDPYKKKLEDPVNTVYSTVQLHIQVQKPPSLSTTSDTPALFPCENFVYSNALSSHLTTEKKHKRDFTHFIRNIKEK
ncbi:SLAM family member 7 [Dasypus novemcinctus]|uniref:SLAM family member 7 n=1 Tax=Dasypus novemcinctus TaxID=9361 RepID=UPI00265EA842|nr:SLAM family member 7 [Dasypus novemcinctus]